MGEIVDWFLANQSFDIIDELQIRKILERHSDWQYVFDKNDDPYAYDLTAWRYNVRKDGHDKTFLGFIEIEVGCGWEAEWPSYYHEVSFLKRKIYVFDWKLNVWKGPKDDIDKTFYLKFNAIHDDCFCKNIQAVYDTGTISSRGDGSYRDAYIVLPMESVTWGIRECVEYIQTGLSKLKETKTV